MISGRTLLLLFGGVLFALPGLAEVDSDSMDLGRVLSFPTSKPWISGYTVWFVLGAVYLLLIVISAKHDLTPSKRES